jgi:integrase
MTLKLEKRGHVYYVRGSVAGMLVRRSAKTSDKSIAEQFLARLQRQLWEEHIYGRKRVITLGEAIDLYLRFGGEGRFLKSIRAAWNERTLDNISGVQIRELAVRLYPDACTATLNRHVVTPICAVINCAADRGFGPSIKVKRFKVQQPIRRSVDREWIEAFRQSASTPYLASLALFNFITGARLGEALALRRSHFELERHIASSEPTKNGEYRQFYLTSELVAELASLPERNGRVFGYRSRSSVYGPWKNTCVRAGISYVPPHQAGRHSFATEMIVRRGVDVATTAEIGNWKSHALLLGTYSHAENHKNVVDTVFGNPTYCSPTTSTDV